MRTPPDSLVTALDQLKQRWGSGAVRLGSGWSVIRAVPRAGTPGAVAKGYALGPVLSAVAPEVVARAAVSHGSVPDEGALAPAMVLSPALAPALAPMLSELSTIPAPLDQGVVSTGFPDLDAILGPGGLVRETSLTLRGGDSSGKTTLALRLIAEAQRQGVIAAYLDLGRSFDPLEAVARGVDLAWLLVLRSADEIEGLRLAGELLGGRTVDLLVVDLPTRLPANGEELLRRLAARSRRAGAQLVVLEPWDLAPSLQATLAEMAGVGLGLQRRSWIRVGRDVIGQRTLVMVEKNRFGPPGRRVELEIRYVEEGARQWGIVLGWGIARALEHSDPFGAETRGSALGHGVSARAGPLHASPLHAVL
jgi:hypothetical protein